VGLFPGRCRNLELQDSMFRGTMPPLTNIPDLNAIGAAVFLSPRGLRPKPDRIPFSVGRQPSTARRVPEIAQVPQFVVRWSLPLMPGCGTASTPSATQRKPMRVHPPSPQLLYRHEKRTRHFRSSEQIIFRTAHSTHLRKCKPADKLPRAFGSSCLEVIHPLRKASLRGPRAINWQTGSGKILSSWGT
jgi:hypothetical protein